MRTLHREATEKDFVVGLNGFITHWDGKGDDGKPVAAGKYFVRGVAVGELETEGVAFFGNDWIADEDFFNGQRPFFRHGKVFICRKKVFVRRKRTAVRFGGGAHFPEKCGAAADIPFRRHRARFPPTEVS